MALLSPSSKATTVSTVKLQENGTVSLAVPTRESEIWYCCLGTIFAYGQTGCGKSHTMMGLVDQLDANGADLKGIIPKSVNHIFGFLDSEANSGKNFLVRCAYLEIYNEQVLDLLSKFNTAIPKGKKTPNQGQKQESLKIKEDPDRGIYV